MAGPKCYKLYAALHEDIAEGVVWLKDHDLPPRCVVKLTYGRGRPVFCEALQFDKNFVERYNKQPRTFKIKDDDESLASLMVINHWYRARLARPSLWARVTGDFGEAIETQKEYPLKIKALDRWYNTHWGKLRACMGHPQVIVRVAAWLGLLSVVGTPGIPLKLAAPA